MPLKGPILCATDLSEAADAALRQGWAIGTQIDAPVSVCHVLPEVFRVRVLFPQEAGIDPAFEADLAQRATAAVRARLDAVIGAEANAAPVLIETGTKHAGVLEIAERLDAGLIVVGPGPTAARVARSAGVPVLVARPSPTGGGVLGTTDFSDPSLPAVRMAAEEATRRGVRFRLLHCLDIDAASYSAAAVPGAITPWPLAQEIMDQLEAAAGQRLIAAMTQTGAHGETQVVRSPPAHGIVHGANAVATALVVVGTRGRTGLARLALGSVAEAVIDRAPCSVLVVPINPA